MRPIEDLLGKTIAEITPEELAAEMAERQTAYEAIPHPLSHKNYVEPDATERERNLQLSSQLGEETKALHKEIARITLQREAPPYPAGIGMLDYSAFWKGIEYGRKLDKFQSANKGHNTKRDSRLFAIKEAGKVTGNYSKIRYADLRKHIAAALVMMDMYCPSDKRITKWLNDAVKEGLLKLPQEMRKGRGLKK